MQSVCYIVGYGTNNTRPAIAEQWIQIADWALANSCLLRGLFVDLSAKASVRHPDLEKAVSLALETRSKFVVHSLENLTTSSAKAIKLMRLFLEAGVPFISLNDQFDSSSTGVDSFSGVILALDNLNRTLNEKRFVMLSLRRAMGEGTENLPYGMMIADDGISLVQNDDEMNMVGTIIRLRRAGRSYRFIANRLTELGIRTRRGGSWHPKVVMSIYNRYEDDRMKTSGIEKKNNGRCRPKVLRAKEKIKVAAFERVRRHTSLKLADTRKANVFLSGIKIL